jgi:hypothetical protein
MGRVPEREKERDVMGGNLAQMQTDAKQKTGMTLANLRAA